MNGIKNLCIKLYLEVKELFKGEDITRIPPGETELDYINPEELKPKRKRNLKQFPEVKSEESFIKTRKKK